ncbi:helix-turn-helix domain-containing protein [Microbacterium sp. KNMS]
MVRASYLSLTTTIIWSARLAFRSPPRWSRIRWLFPEDTAHRNARVTVHGRCLIIARARRGWPQAHIAAAMGVSRQCVARWITRYRDQGDLGLEDRSSRPGTMPTKTPHRTEQAVLARRRAERVSRDEIAWRRC